MTPRELIDSALADAGRAQPDVRAAALLHAARVVTAWDREEAIRLLDRGIDLARTLDEPDRQVMLQQALDLSGTVSPPRTFELASSLTNDETGLQLHKALYDMLQHGDATAAVDYLVGDERSLDDYPLDPAMRAMWKGKDDATRGQLLRRIASALLNPASWEWVRHRSLGEFCRHFTTWSGLLPRDEASSIVRQLVDRVLSEPDGRISAGFNGVRFSSTREYRLFELLGPLRQVDPARADLLIREYDQLAAAAAVYPDGMDMRPALTSQPRPAPTAPPVKQEMLMVVGQQLIPISELAKTNFRDLFDRALHLYAVDSDTVRPNDAPMDVWPSTHEFRSILFHIGRHEGDAAVRHLDRIPDATVRVLAQIELAAALAGLTEFGGRSMSPGPLGFREGWKRRAKERARGPRPGPSIASRRPPLPKPKLPPSYDLHVVRAAAGGDTRPAGGSGRDYLTLDSVRLRPLLARLYDVSDTRIDLQPSVDGSRYTLSLVLPAPESPARMHQLLRDGLEKHFSIRREAQRMSVRVLTAPNGIRARKAIDDGMFGFGSLSAGIGAVSTGSITTSSEAPSHLTDGFALAEILDFYLIDEESSPSKTGMMQRQNRMFRLLGAPSRAHLSGIQGEHTMADLCAMLEPGLGQPIVDETHLDGRYTINVETTERTTAGFLEVLCGQLGLAADVTERDVEILVARPRA